ncbi:MAG: WD40 repeat domain-containing protein [Verrucomicrobiales bacterium]
MNAIHFSPDGSRLLAATGIAGLRGVAFLFDAASGEKVGEFGGHRDVLYDAEFSPDGSLIATAGYDRTIKIWGAQSGELQRAIDVHKGAVFDLAFHPSGEILASASADQTVKLWRVRDGERLDTLNQPLGEQTSVAFTPDGGFVISAGADSRIHLWTLVSRDAPAINPLRHARFAHEGAIERLAVIEGGDRLVSSAADGSLKLWSLPDLQELHAFPQQPDAAAAVAAKPGAREFVAARLDGSRQSYALPATGVAAGVAERNAAPMPAAAEDASAPVAVAEAEPNDSPRQAVPVPLPAMVSGGIGAPGDADVFRFRALAGQELLVGVNAARSGSKLDSKIEILTAGGEPVERVVLQAVRDSWFTFRGKDSDTSDDFRLQNWREMELNEYLYANGEVVKLWLYPRGPDSGFKVYPGSGKRWTYFGTTANAHPLGEPCYVVQPLPPGSAPPPNGLPVFRLYYENDDDPGRRAGSDSQLLFTAPADGEFLARISDVRGFGGDGFPYTLEIRGSRPDFAVSVGGTNPKVSPGSGREITFNVERREGFDGEIRIDVANLPPGFRTSAPVVIQAGHHSAVGVLFAEPDAADPDPAADEAVAITATAMVRGTEVTRPLGTLGDIGIAPPAKLAVEILREDGSAADPGAPLVFAIRPGETITARVRATRHDFPGRIELGGDDSGRNLPHGLYVDNIGLNGLLIVEGQTEREFFITAAPWVPPGDRFFHLRATADGGQASRPALIRVLPKAESAAR